jgi:hypothetical protein
MKERYHLKEAFLLFLMQDITRGNDIHLLLHYSHIESICYCFLNKLFKHSELVLSAHARDYLPALKTVFESVGLDYLYHVNDFKKEILMFYQS